MPSIDSETREKISETQKRRWEQGRYAKRKPKPAYVNVLERRIAPALETLGFVRSGLINAKGKFGGVVTLRPHFTNYERKFCVVIIGPSKRDQERCRTAVERLPELGYRVMVADKRNATHSPDALLEAVYLQLKTASL